MSAKVRRGDDTCRHRATEQSRDSAGLAVVGLLSLPLSLSPFQQCCSQSVSRSGGGSISSFGFGDYYSSAALAISLLFLEAHYFVSSVSASTTTSLQLQQSLATFLSLFFFFFLLLLPSRPLTAFSSPTTTSAASLIVRTTSSPSMVCAECLAGRCSVPLPPPPPPQWSR